ncbi:uncharacterized protein LOC129582698 isoform X2 [Paramacrobiotus metropolitanus]|nr:uncharacterized protein LOC129582698 isoform X2 [Paramacrobiotus metropolitanus]XP_055330263.1 uncharacterized protein LOC129582698 isoform X2 [Paramacrobiotus metropolitanus]XP_055330264.1 uncharacterized protein LOC129582698 isoform X2 [Paramacrobiotus metropolitanus]XP_055330265.1 uncharacterized protein LOC129582698 isoform X2 [Paramacrobiotus metropolitanus]
MRRSHETQSPQTPSTDAACKPTSKLIMEILNKTRAEQLCRSNSMVHGSDVPSHMQMYRQTLYLALQHLGKELGVDLQRSDGSLTAYNDRKVDATAWSFSLQQLDDVVGRWGKINFDPPRWMTTPSSDRQWERNFQQNAVSLWEVAIRKTLNIGPMGMSGYRMQHRGLMQIACLPHIDYWSVYVAVSRWKTGMFPDIGFSLKPETYHLTFLCNRYNNDLDAVVTACRQATLLNTFEPMDPRMCTPSAQSFFPPHYGGAGAPQKDAVVIKTTPQPCSLHDLRLRMSGHTGVDPYMQHLCCYEDLPTSGESLSDSESDGDVSSEELERQYLEMERDIEGELGDDPQCLFDSRDYQNYY